MKWCVSFPEESVLVVRPCLNAICAGVKPAAKLLSVLLYRYSIRQEHREDADNINEARATKGEEANQDTTFRIYRKQSQLVTDMCGEITEKTLHDVAVPTLQLLGFLDVDESSPVHCYDVHLDVVASALEAFKQGSKQLEKFLIANIQLEKFLIDAQLEKLLINKKNFQLNKKYFLLALEKVLIANRKISNNKRGRKPSSQVASEGVFADPQISIEISNKIREDTKERERHSAHVEMPALASPHVDAARALPSQSDHHAQCHFCSEEAELTCRECGKQVCYVEHGRRFPLSETENHDYCLPCLDAHNAEDALRHKEPEPAHQQDHGAGTPNGAVVTPDVPPSGVLPTSKGKKAAEPKTETPKSPPEQPPSDMPWGTRKCLLWFDYWRGGILIGAYKNSQASTCAKGLAAQFDEQTVIQARTDMEADPYYMAKGGCDVCDVANNIHKYLKKRQNKVITFRGKQPPIPQEDLVEWQGRMMTVTEADTLGFNGGFGAYL